MVSSKSTTFVFCLVFIISTSLNSSLAYTNQVTRKVVVEDENGFTMTSGSSLRHMEHKKLEPQRVSKDANKVLDMMNKDYTGGSPSGPNPRHKPPINNHESLDNGRGPPTFASGGTRAGPGRIVTCGNRTRILPEFFPIKRAHLPLEPPYWVRGHRLYKFERKALINH
nr:uncharacterized protein LOC109184085 isoform X3 [Ipomoea batatas]